MNIKRGRIQKRYRFLALFLLCFFQAQWSLAENKISKKPFLGDKDTPWQITAKSLSYREKEELYVAKGDVVFSKDGHTLHAQEAIYNVKTGIAKVSGDVRFESGGDILKAERGVFHLKDRTGKIINGRLFLKQNHFYLNGEVMEKLAEDTYLLKNCRLTTCDGPNPAWSITGSEVKVTVEGYGKIKNAAFRILDVPFFYVPYMIFPAKTKRQTGLLPPRLGYSERRGTDIEIPFFWAISDQIDATFYERLMTDRGFMQGLEFRYLTDNESKGVFLFDVLSDRIGKKDMNNPDEVELSPFPRTNETRYWLRSRADHQLPSNLTARLDVDFVSDQDYLKEFEGGLTGFKTRTDLFSESRRPVEERHSPTRRSALRLSHDREDYSLQALASYHQRPENPPNDETSQPLWGLNFTILPRPLPKLPLYLSFNSDYDYIWRDFGQKGHRLSFTPEISYPIWLGPYLEFEPSFSFTKDLQWLDQHNKNIDYQSRNAYQIQSRLSTILERTFDFDLRNVKKLKHKIVPSLIYRYRGHKDESDYRPWFEPIDVEGKVNQFTFSIDNLLDARKEDGKGGVTYTQWGTFSVRQDYDLDEARDGEIPWRGERPFGPLVGILTLTPFPGMDLDAEAHWDHYEDDISYTDLSLEFSIERSGGREDRFEVDYQNLEDGNRYLNYRFDVNLLYGLSAGTSLTRNMSLDKTIASSYWLEYRFQCWGVQLITEKLDDVSSIMVTFRLLGLGDVRGR